MRAKYVVGCDGARSGVREAIGRKHVGEQAYHAWGVMDVLAVTDFPDIRTKCAIQSRGRQHPAHPARGRLPLPHVRRPRRGRRRTTTARVRQTTIETIIAKANDILHPVHARREGRRLAQRLRGRPPGDRQVRRRAGRASRHAHAARLHRRRRLPHAQREGRPGHERVDAGRLQPRLEARARAHGPQPGVAARDLLGRASGRRAEPHRLRPGVVDADGASKPEEFDDPPELEDVLRARRPSSPPVS